MKCPGQDTQYWTSGAIFEVACPQCNAGVEFFKDDTSRKCGQCGHRFINPRMDFGCAAYCSYAEQCLGDLPPELVAEKEDLLKDRVAIAVKRHLKNDFKSIGRAVRRARHAEEIGKAAQVNLSAVLMASYLWDLDKVDDDELPVAHAILSDLKAPMPLIEHVCAILARRQQASSDEADREYITVQDAHSIALWEDEIKDQPVDPSALEQQIDGECRTDSGRQYARKIFIGIPN